MSDEYATLRLAHAAGATIQANRGTTDDPIWVDLDDPQYTCDSRLYRVKPESES